MPKKDVYQMMSETINDIIDRAFTKAGELWKKNGFDYTDFEEMRKESPQTAQMIDELSDKIDEERDTEKCMELCQKYVNAHNHMFKRRSAIKAGKKLKG